MAHIIPIMTGTIFIIRLHVTSRISKRHTVIIITSQTFTPNASEGATISQV